MPDKEDILKQEIIRTGQRLSEKNLVVARAGNLSARIDENDILITATGTSLGDLKEEDIIKVDLTEVTDVLEKRLSTEFPLHSLIYKNFPVKTIIHCHPPLINGYFAVYSDLKILTFEAKLYLGDVPVVEQETPSITKPELVVGALKTNNLAVIKNHGVVGVAQTFTDGLYLIESLEEAVKVAGVARLFKKEALDDLDKALKEDLTRKDTTEAYPMFSPEHIQAIVDLVNKDEFIAKKGQEADLTLQLAIKLDGHNEVYKFIFEKGKISRLEYDGNAPFVISAPREVWELIFLGKLDPFVATTQGRMKLKGDLGKLSRWYVPFSRLFELFKQVKIK
ncbi:MAG: class II aldolase/adducin family protein [Candidatus Omnitrophota bacterium]|nr:class II aldolase/adducin family protein [Candidatus Omnitrophota bacterium]